MINIQKPFFRTRLILTAIAAFSLVSGCSSPDYWYDTTELFSAPEIQKHMSPVQKEPQPEPQNLEQPLPEPKDGTIELSLEEAVLYSLQRNPELLANRYGPVIQVTFEQIERGKYDPEVFAELQYFEETATEVSRSTRDRFSVEGEDTDVTLGLRQELPTGSAIETTVDYERSTSNRTPEQQAMRLGLTVTQSLLQGFGPVVNLIDIRQAELNTKASFYELRGFTEALVSEVEIVYWQHVLARQGIAIFKQSLEIAKKQLQEVENRIEVGVIPRNSAAAARAEVARREQALIEARSNAVEKRLRLLRLLNVTDHKKFLNEVTPTSIPQTETTPVTELDRHVDLAMQFRPDLNESKLKQKQQELEVVRTRNGLLPKLDFFIEIGKTGYAESFSDSFSDLENDNYDFLTGLRFSHYLGNRRANNEHLAAILTREKELAAIENLKNLIQLDVLLAANEINRTRQQIEATKVTKLLQEQTLKAEQERFSVGDITSLLVAQAQRDLLVSQLSEIEAIVDYRIALVRFYLAEGSLLERRGISLESARSTSALHSGL